MTAMRIALAAALFAGPAVLPPGSAAAQDAARGEEVFRRCASCHMIGPDARNRTGPALTGVIGRTAGSVPDFRYSPSMETAGADGLTWTEEAVFAYLQDPTGFLRDYLDDPGARAKMTFRLADETDRRDVIAYLASVTDQAATGPGGDTVAISTQAASDEVCVGNGTQSRFLFAAQAPEGARVLQELAPGEVLCSSGTGQGPGVVSVYEDADVLEGCSRLVAPGRVEGLLRYADFDRCAWTSNS